MKDKSNLNHGRGNIACAFPWCSFLIVINIAAGRLLKLCIHELLHANNSYVFTIRKKMIYRSSSPFCFSGRRRYLFCMKHIHDLSQTCSCHIEIKNHTHNICFTPIDFKCPATGQSKTIWYSHVLPLLKNKNSYAAASPERQNIGI